MPTSRLISLYLGLVLFGTSMALFVDAGLGLVPWDVFHQGIARHTGMSLGTTVIIVGALVLLLWIPLRERPGFGTISNVVVIGLALDRAAALLPTPTELGPRLIMVVAGVLLNAFATLLYLKARMGAGPRDGLLTALLRITRLPTMVIKTGIEVTVVTAGWLLGGTVGVATLVFVLTVGPTIQVMGLLLPGLALGRPDTAVRPEPTPVHGVIL
jgi:uncharacterized membrane protein YczE